MSNAYSAADLESMRAILAPGVEKAKLLAAMQLEAASKLAQEKGLPQDAESVIAIAQVIATTWAGMD